MSSCPLPLLIEAKAFIAQRVAAAKEKRPCIGLRWPLCVATAFCRYVGDNKSATRKTRRSPVPAAQKGPFITAQPQGMSGQILRGAELGEGERR